MLRDCRVICDVHSIVKSWASYKIRTIAGAHAPGIPGTFSPPPRVSDPDMHQGTCVTHVLWCMPGSLTTVFLWIRRQGKTFPAFPAHAQPANLRIWQEAHAQRRTINCEVITRTYRPSEVRYRRVEIVCLVVIYGLIMSCKKQNNVWTVITDCLCAHSRVILLCNYLDARATFEIPWPKSTGHCFKSIWTTDYVSLLSKLRLEAASSLFSLRQKKVHSCSKVMGFFLRWQHMVFIFKVQTWNFVCGIMRSFAFTMENIWSIWYTATPGRTSKFGKVWKTRCQNAATRANIWRCFLVSWDDKYLWVMVSNNRHELNFL